jgi:thioredoxin reductase (NADPH)
MIDTPALIVGAGPVGLYQAFQLGLLDIPCHLVDTLPHPGGQCAELYPDKPIYDIPGVPATTGLALIDSLRLQIEPFTRRGTVQLHLGQQVSEVSRQDDGRFTVTTSAGQTFVTQTLFIAAGAGAFVPRRLRVPGLEAFEGSQLLYQWPEPGNQGKPSAKGTMAGRHLVIQGDDDNALDWAIAGATDTITDNAGAPASVTLLHRRDVFTASPDRIARMRALCAEGRLRFVAGQITAPAVQDPEQANQDNAAQGVAPAAPQSRLCGLHLALPDGSSEILPADLLLASLGLSPRLGPLADWGLAMQRKQLSVDTEKFQTSEPGIFAVGDINTYPGKKKLIVCGFHECVLAAFAAADIVFPGKPPALQYTTTSSRLHTLLGVTGL